MQKRTDFFDNSLSRIVPDIPLVIRNKPHNNQLCADLSRLISAYPVVSHFLRFAWQTTPEQSGIYKKAAAVRQLLKALIILQMFLCLFQMRIRLLRNQQKKRQLKKRKNLSMKHRKMPMKLRNHHL